MSSIFFDCNDKLFLIVHNFVVHKVVNLFFSPLYQFLYNCNVNKSLNPSHNGKGDSSTMTSISRRPECLNPGHNGKENSFKKWINEIY